MRTFGRTINSDGTKTWQVVQTDSAGFDDYVWITTLIQCLQLTPGESPFFANYGIPAQQSIVTQMYPDFYVALLQSQFSQYFASLSIKKISGTITNSSPVTTWGLQTLNNVYKSDWQGRQLQYSTPRTNLQPYSVPTNATWANNGLTGTDGYGTAPNGVLASTYMTNAVGGTRYKQTGSVTAGVLNVRSIFIKPSVLTDNLICYVDGAIGAGGAFSSAQVSFAGVNGSPVLGGIASAGGIIAIGGGWYRMWVAFTPLTTSACSDHVYPLTANITEWWGDDIKAAQAGVTGPTSYIGTNGVPVTVTDYSIIGNNIIFSNPPLSKAILDWSGTAISNMGDVQNFYQSTFGIGDGIKTAFPLNLPASSGKVPGPEYDIKIVRNNGSIFNQVIAV